MKKFIYFMFCVTIINECVQILYNEYKDEEKLSKKIVEFYGDAKSLTPNHGVAFADHLLINCLSKKLQYKNVSNENNK